jgi:hypothetical protein
MLRAVTCERRARRRTRTLSNCKPASGPAPAPTGRPRPTATRAPDRARPTSQSPWSAMPPRRRSSCRSTPGSIGRRQKTGTPRRSPTSTSSSCSCCPPPRSRAGARRSWHWRSPASRTVGACAFCRRVESAETPPGSTHAFRRRPLGFPHDVIPAGALAHPPPPSARLLSGGCGRLGRRSHRCRSGRISGVPPARVRRMLRSSICGEDRRLDPRRPNRRSRRRKLPCARRRASMSEC